jgi:hypothetical protein
MKVAPIAPLTIKVVAPIAPLTIKVVPIAPLTIKVALTIRVALTIKVVPTVILHLSIQKLSLKMAIFVMTKLFQMKRCIPLFQEIL